MKVNACVQTLKAAQASQNMEEVLAVPQTVQHMRDWRTAIRQRDLKIWPLEPEEETVLGLLEEYLV